MTIELTSKDTAEAIAARLRADDPEWQYIVRESKTSLAHPLNHSRTGNYIIAVYDDSGEFLGQLPVPLLSATTKRKL